MLQPTDNGEGKLVFELGDNIVVFDPMDDWIAIQDVQDVYNGQPTVILSAKEVESIVLALLMARGIIKENERERPALPQMQSGTDVTLARPLDFFNRDSDGDD